MTEYDGPTVNGRPALTAADVQAWCRQAHGPVLSEAAANRLAATLNYAAFLMICWHPAADPIRRLGPTFAPKVKRGRGRPHRLENNVASNLRKQIITLWQAEHPAVRVRQGAADIFIEAAMDWLQAPAAADTLARAARRRRHASPE